jgi:hypothetical protein
MTRKIILASAIAIFATLLAFPALVEAQQAFPNPIIPNPIYPPTPPPTITAITVTPTTNNSVFTDLGHGLMLVTVCRDGGQPNSPVLIGLHNIGSDTATINFLFSDGGTTVTASGQVLQALFGEFQALYNNKRIEGQFIFANSVGNTTVNLHAFDGGTFCEIRGTAVFAPNPPQLVIPPFKQ